MLSAGPVAGDSSAQEEARRLFAQPCRLVLSAARLDQAPDGLLPEVAFAGRSNVGKSSLVNALTSRNTLARTSNTPGRTQQLNFFILGERLMLADLPGYGYAQAPKTRVQQWTRLVERYLKARVPLRRVLLLIDARHGTMAVDRGIMAMLDKAAVSYQLVLTKCDKLTVTALAQRLAHVEAELKRHGAAYPDVIASSARTGLGVADLRLALSGLADWSAVMAESDGHEGSALN